MSHFYSLRISEVNLETQNAVSITFEVPSQLSETFAFKAGQYITIKHMHEGTEIRRAYSICSTPGGSTFTIGVKKVSKGAFSVYANTKLQAGDTLEVMPPEGKFTVVPQPDQSRSFLAFAAGSGITPVLSIIKTTLLHEPNSKFTLVYGNQSLTETMFHKELLKLKKEFPDQFVLEFFYSRKLDEGATFGRIERSTVNHLLKNKFKGNRFDLAYLCGPEPMIDEVSSVLKEHGYNEKQILFELFSTAEKGLLTKAHDGNSNVTIVLDDDTESFEMPQHKSILDAALDHGMEPPYSCQGGICSTCIARLKEGTAEMRKNQILTDEDLADGLILTCQAHPTSATIVIDYDDV
ncbi:MAG: flavodoxin reductase [Flavobacteriaceae bacterium]|nr:flavodoxin reductase [Flavobacteriaceae bacterium]